MHYIIYLYNEIVIFLILHPMELSYPPTPIPTNTIAREIRR